MLLNCGVREASWESLWQQVVKPINPKGNQSWIFIGRTDAEAETPILWPPDVKNWVIGKDPYSGKDWMQEEKGNGRGWDGWMTLLTGWAWLWAPLGVGDGQGGLACCSPWGPKESGLTEKLNWTDWSGVLYTCEWMNKWNQKIGDMLRFQDTMLFRICISFDTLIWWYDIKEQLG